MIDGVSFADHLCVVALGIDIDGTKHPLGLVEGSTENTTVVKGLLTGLRDRGLDTTRPILAVLDGAKALAAGPVSPLVPRRDRLGHRSPLVHRQSHDRGLPVIPAGAGRRALRAHS